MTTFEIIIIAILAVIMLMVIILVKTVIGGFHDVWQNQNAQWNQQRSAEQNLDEKFKHLTDMVEHKLTCVASYTYDAKRFARELKDIEKKNQELLMPVIEWQRRLVGADSATCETTDKED